MSSNSTTTILKRIVSSGGNNNGSSYFVSPPSSSVAGGYYPYYASANNINYLRSIPLVPPPAAPVTTTSSPYYFINNNNSINSSNNNISINRNKIVLGYWKIRGLATAPRLLMSYAKYPFEEKLYELPDDLNRDIWLKEKFTLGLDFPNLPYLYDGDFKITQSSAILLYLARKFGLAGTNDKERALIDMLIGEIADIREPIVSCSYSPKDQYLANREKIVANYTSYLERLEKFLGSSNNYFVGNKLSCADFLTYDIIDVCRWFAFFQDKNYLDRFPHLKRFVERFENIPSIKEYMNSPNWLFYPFNNKSASFGGALTAATDNPKLQ